MHSRKLAGGPVCPGGPRVLLMLTAALTLLAAACGSQDQAAAPAAGSGTPQTPRQQDDGLKTSLVTRPDRAYALDELTAAGWKKSRTFETGTLPGATAAALGFFNQRDIEVWVYPSHGEALEFGVPPAEQAVARKPGSASFTSLSVAKRYYAYAVAGNLVLLCERELADCEALIARLP